MWKKYKQKQTKKKNGKKNAEEIKKTISVWLVSTLFNLIELVVV